MRKVLALCATASVLALAACGSGSSSDLSSISVKPASDDKTAPEVSFDTPFVTDKDEAVTLEQGDGAEINPGDTISIKSGLYKAIDGLNAGENFTGQATSMTVDDSMKQQMPELYDRLVDSKVGDWIAYSSVEGTQQADGSIAEPEEGAKAERIIVLHVEDSTAASGTMSKDEVAKQKKEGKLPTVKVTDGKPTITIPKDTEAPKDLAVDVLEEGKGGSRHRDLQGQGQVLRRYLGRWQRIRWQLRQGRGHRIQSQPGHQGLDRRHDRPEGRFQGTADHSGR
ncbi:hypothetical protein AAHB37_09100 [Glutamicibacter halophytocola]